MCSSTIGITYVGLMYIIPVAINYANTNFILVKKSTNLEKYIIYNACIWRIDASTFYCDDCNLKISCYHKREPLTGGD